MWLKCSSPRVASASTAAASRSMRLSTASQSSSTEAARLARTTPIGSTVKGVMHPSLDDSGLDGGAVGADHPPDLVAALALGVARGGVAGVGVERLAVDRDLGRAVGGGDG